MQHILPLVSLLALSACVVTPIRQFRFLASLEEAW